MSRDQNKSSIGKITGFSIFLFGSVLLIMVIWANELFGSNVDQTNYVRSTLVISTPPGYEETLSAMPTKGHGEGTGEGQGKGDGGEDHEDHPTPTINFTTLPTEDDV